MATEAQIKITADTSQAERALGSLTNGLKALVALAGANQIIKFADAYTQLSNKISSTSQNQQEYNTAMRAVQKIATETATPLNDVANLYTKLSITGQQWGLSQTQILRAVENTTKSLKVYGVESAAASSYIYQFGQATGFAAVRYEEWNQMMEASPALVRDIAAAFGKTTQQMTADIQNSLVGPGDLIRAQEYLLKNKIGPMWKDYQKTVNDSIVSIQNSFVQLLGRLESSTGIFSKVASSLDWVGKNLDIVTAAAVGFLTVMTVQKVLGIAQAFGILNATMARNPVVALATGLLAAATALATYLGVSKEAEKVINKEAEAQKKLNEEVLKYEGPKIDAKALRGQLDAFMKQYDLKLRIAQMTQVEAEYEQALFKFAQDQKMPLEAVRKIVGDTLQKKIASVIAAEQEKKITQEYQYALEASNSVMMLMGVATVAEMNARDKIQQIQREIGIELSDAQVKQIFATEQLKLQKGYLLDIASSYEKINRPRTGPAAGAELMKALPSLSIDAALREQQTIQDTLFAGAEWNYKRGLITETQYEQAKLSIKQQYLQQTLALEQKAAEDRMRINGVTNQAIIDAVKNQMANVKMIQAGGITGAQGVLGAMDQVFGAMSANNKKAFEIHKKLAIAQAMISTYQAAAAAIAFPPGPPLSFIYVAGAIAAGLAQVAAIRSQEYSGRALGGPIMGNKSYIVGERGPELFTPNTAGQITRNDQLGGSTTNVNFTIVANDTTGFDTLLNSRKGMIKQLISDAMLDKGQRF